MKKSAIIIFLAFMYAASSTGFAVKADYCCNVLQSLKLVLAQGTKDKEGCCKVKYQSLKVNDSHAAADVITAPALPFAFINVLHQHVELVAIAHVTNSNCIDINAPPPLGSSPVYLSNCVFRI